MPRRRPQRLPDDVLALLGEREQKVCALICEGLTSREIASILQRSVSTVRNQTIAVYRKLEVNSRMELAQMIRSGPQGASVAVGSSLSIGRATFTIVWLSDGRTLTATKSRKP